MYAETDGLADTDANGDTDGEADTDGDAETDGLADTDADGDTDGEATLEELSVEFSINQLAASWMGEWDIPRMYQMMWAGQTESKTRSLRMSSTPLARHGHLRALCTSFGLNLTPRALLPHGY